MADKNDKRANRSEDKSLFSIVLGLPITLFVTLALSALISTCIEWAGMYFDWWDVKGILHSQQMVTAELGHLNARLSKNIVELTTGVTVKDMFDATVGFIAMKFEHWGLLHYGQRGSGFLGVYVGAAVNIFLLTFIRFFVFLFSIVMFILFGLVGFTIGVFERDKRRAGGGRESGAIFHLARRSVAPSVGLAAFLYLAWPNTIDPVLIIFPFAVAFGVAVAYMAAAYKKYV